MRFETGTRIVVTRFVGVEQFFSLVAKVFEVGTGWELFGRDNSLSNGARHPHDELRKG